MQKSPCTSSFTGKDRRGAGKAAHRQHRIGLLRSEKPYGSAA